MSETETLTAARTPTVYFIDDSATMREVIKIAFSKENIHVVTCPDAASAMAQFGVTAPDAVITDVIMPDKDGYEVCQFIKQHDQLGHTPVILMSGVVNRTVAEKAMAVKADELIRKPFQPRDLIARVKTLLTPGRAGTMGSSAPANDDAESAHASSRVLSSVFGASPASMAVSGAATPRTTNLPFSAGGPQAASACPPAATANRARAVMPSSPEVQRLRNEIRRYELLVKKLQAELEAEHQYCAALEAHFKALQESE